jgi:hypothetical protein
VALHDVAPQEVAHSQRALEVHGIAHREVAEGGDGEGLRPHVEGERVAATLDDGQADPVDGHARSQIGAVEGLARRDDQASPPAVEHASQLLDDPGEHG